MFEIHLSNARYYHHNYHTYMQIYRQGSIKQRSQAAQVEPFCQKSKPPCWPKPKTNTPQWITLLCHVMDKDTCGSKLPKQITLNIPGVCTTKTSTHTNH